MLKPKNMIIKLPPPQNRRQRGGRAEVVVISPVENSEPAAPIDVPSDSQPAASGTKEAPEINIEELRGNLPPQISVEEALEKVAAMQPASDVTTTIQSEHLYCPECYLPLHPDPQPEKLYIFLHALKYTTSLGEFSTEMPEWAAEGWVWDQS